VEKRNKKQEKLSDFSDRSTSREFSAGGVVFKKAKEEKSRKKRVLWLVTKSSPSKIYPKSYWRFPKGWLDDEYGGKKPGALARGERKATEKEIQDAALREVQEEAGVKAKIIKKIGSERYFYKIKERLITKFVTFYLMEWQKDLPEGFGSETSKVEWLVYDEARKKLLHSGERKVLDKAEESFRFGNSGKSVIIGAQGEVA